MVEVAGLTFRRGGHFTFLFTDVIGAHLHDLHVLHRCVEKWKNNKKEGLPFKALLQHSVLELRVVDAENACRFKSALHTARKPASSC